MQTSEVHTADIRGFQEITLIDWDKKIASIIFLSGCNFRCGFCHSSGLVLHPEELKPIPFEDIRAFLEKKRGWIDGVVITGGEPMLDKAGLFGLVRAIKGMGLLAKVDTNGTKPRVLKELTESKMVDYVAMDIKTVFDSQRYKKAAAAELNIDDIAESRDILLASGMDYEFRTTVVPGVVDFSDIAEIARAITGAKKYCLQQFVPRDSIDKSFLELKPYTADELEKMAAIASEYIPNVFIKNS